MGKFYSREGPTLYTSMPPVSGALVSVQMLLTNEPYRSLAWSADEASSLHLGRVLRHNARLFYSPDNELQSFSSGRDQG